MQVNKTFSTSSNFDGLFMCTFTDDPLITFFIFNPPKLGNKQQNMFPKLHLETGNGKTSFNTLKKKQVLGKKNWRKKKFYNT